MILAVSLVGLLVLFTKASVPCGICKTEACIEPQDCKTDLILDLCGCCKVCAKREGEDCGGFLNMLGNCGPGLICQVRHPKSMANTLLPPDSKIGKCEPEACKEVKCGMHQWCTVENSLARCKCNSHCKHESGIVCGLYNGVNYASSCEVRNAECELQQKIDWLPGPCLGCNHEGKEYSYGDSIDTTNLCEKKVCMHGKFQLSLDKHCMNQNGYNCSLQAINHEAIACPSGMSCKITKINDAVENGYPHLGHCVNNEPDFCYHQTKVYRAGETFVDETCTGSCTCEGNNAIACVSLCPPTVASCSEGFTEVLAAVQVSTEPSCSCHWPRCVNNSEVCSREAYPGECYAHFERWYHDAQTGECKIFIFGGCSSNGNNFLTKEECESACRAQQHPTSEAQSIGIDTAAAGSDDESDDVKIASFDPAGVEKPIPAFAKDDPFSSKRSGTESQGQAGKDEIRSSDHESAEPFDESSPWKSGASVNPDALKFSNATMMIRGRIVFPHIPGRLPTPSCLHLKFVDTSLMDAPSITVAETLLRVSDVVMSKTFDFVLESKKPGREEHWRSMSVQAVLNVGWCPDGKSNEWVRYGDYLTDTMHPILLAENADVYEKDISLIYYGARSAATADFPTSEEIVDDGKVEADSVKAAGDDDEVFRSSSDGLVSTSMLTSSEGAEGAATTDFSRSPPSSDFQDAILSKSEDDNSIKNAAVAGERGISSLHGQAPSLPLTSSEAGERSDGFEDKTRVAEAGGVAGAESDASSEKTKSPAGIQRIRKSRPTGRVTQYVPEGPKLSNTTMKLFGQVLFKRSPGLMAANSCVRILFKDISIADASSVLVHERTYNVSGQDVLDSFNYSLELLKPTDSELHRQFAVSAVVNIGWCATGLTSAWIREGDYLSDTTHRVSLKPEKAEYEKDIHLVYYCHSKECADKSLPQTETGVKRCYDDVSGKYFDDDESWKPDPCTTCVCDGGEARCAVVTCAPLNCRNPILEPGACCSTCAEANDVKCYEKETDRWFDLGSMWSSEDGCISCQCTRKGPVCASPMCALPLCASGVLMNVKGRCCPVCSTDKLCKADDSGKVYVKDRDLWQLANCSVCRCGDDGVVCTLPDGQRACEHPVRLSRDCPQFCLEDLRSDKCLELSTGRRYQLGDKWNPSPCESCVCEKGGNVLCSVLDCLPLTNCANIVRRENQCCPVCEDYVKTCAYGERMFADGEHVVKEDRCTICRCAKGSWACSEDKCRRDAADVCTDKELHYKVGDVIMQDCNTCFCVKGGTWACTLMACPATTSAPSNATVTPRLCFHGDEPYKTGEVRSEGCNACTCTNGAWTCTTEPCPHETKSQLCYHGDMMYKTGESRLSDDGCNSCFCFDGIWGCTLKACVKTNMLERGDDP